ncbi:MAG: Ca2+-dependent phosphoinositide-specific phospholipase C, partial [Myxococcota bacterium]|nr:Ca2+-dependent phosphoinositide-specific phospholipase C [Myxococcota bacterium]
MLALALLSPSCGDTAEVPEPDVLQDVVVPSQVADVEADAEVVSLLVDVADVAGVDPPEVVDDVVWDADVPAGPESDAKPQLDYPLDDLLTIHDLQVKGSHNSYHVAPLFPIDGSWAYTHEPLDVQLEEYGVRQVELDIHDPTGTDFSVYHVPVVDAETNCESLVDCLTLVKDWSDKNPTHHMLFICIEVKDLGLVKIDDPATVDQAILSVWPEERIVTPDFVRGEHPDLLTALSTDGWPTLGETRGKAMFISLDEGGFRDKYLEGHPTLEDRVMFARNGRGEPWGAMIETGDESLVAEVLAEGYLVRSHTDSPQKSDEDNQANAETAMGSGAHLLSSDVLEPVEDGYWFD